MSDLALEEKRWWNFLGDDLRELLLESQVLINKAGKWSERFSDYSFVVFPAAKAYEGFLKKLFLEKNFIGKEEYLGKRFRIGRALNPSLDRKFRSESVYDRIVDYCGGRGTADIMWDTWKNSRNMLFHWFPDEKNVVSYPEAVERVKEIVNTMDESFNVCKINYASK